MTTISDEAVEAMRDALDDYDARDHGVGYRADARLALEALAVEGWMLVKPPERTSRHDLVGTLRAVELGEDGDGDDAPIIDLVVEQLGDLGEAHIGGWVFVERTDG